MVYDPIKVRQMSDNGSVGGVVDVLKVQKNTANILNVCWGTLTSDKRHYVNQGKWRGYAVFEGGG